MAAPNIVNVTTITGKTAVANVVTSDTSLVSNAAASGKVFKINTIIVSNIDGTNSAEITVKHFDQAGAAGGSHAIGSTIAVPADSSLVVLDKNSAIYLEENRSIGVLAGTTGDLQAICSYEEIS
jgi:hypothetical protein